jgi:hypothetical protein
MGTLDDGRKVVVNSMIIVPFRSLHVLCTRAEILQRSQRKTLSSLLSFPIANDIS